MQDENKDTLPEEAQIVREYLDASMKPDPDLAATYVADDVTITFTGGRVFKHPSGPTGFNAKRYKWVKKKMDRFDVARGADGDAGRTHHLEKPIILKRPII